MSPIECSDRFRIGLRDTGIVLFALFFMLFISAMAGSTRYGEPDNDVARESDRTVVVSTIERLVNRAPAAWRDKDSETVVQTLSAIIAIPSFSQPVKAAALQDWGNAYMKLGDPVRAVHEFDASLALSPDEPERLFAARYGLRDAGRAGAGSVELYPSLARSAGERSH